MKPLLIDHTEKSCEDVEEVHSQNRVRGDTMQSEDSGGVDGYKHISKYFYFTIMTDAVSQFIRAMTPRIKTRARVYLFLFVIITLLLMAKTDSTTLYGCSAAQWYEFIGLVFVYDMVFAALDELFFILLDEFWVGRDDLRLFIHCLSGPAGYIMLTVYLNMVHGKLDVRHTLSFWDTLISMAILALFIYVFRQFLTRGNYNSIIVNRFQGRLKQLELHIRVLSLLASWQPSPVGTKATSQLMDESGKGSNEPGLQDRSRPPHKSGHDNDSREQSPDFETNGTPSTIGRLLLDDVGPLMPTRIVSGGSDQGKSSSEASNRPTDSVKKKKSVAREVFKEIVEASKDVVHETQEVLSDKNVEEMQKHKNFWNTLHILGGRVMKIKTYSGTVVISTQQHAKSFGKRLYLHLSRNNTVHVTPEYIKTIVEETIAEHCEEPLEGNIDEIIDDLFNCKNARTMVMSKIFLEDICSSLKKTHKSLAMSLSDFGQLHNTLKRILDGLFWVVFVVLSEIVFGFDAFTILAPLLTLILAASFAIGPVIGNLFMAIGHVLFFLNYDVGHRIAINVTGDKRLVVDVQQITLVATTGITIYNEEVQLPNHQLFSEKIMNLTESSDATLEIPCSFPMSGPNAPTQDKINEFWKEVNRFALEEHRESWCFSFVSLWGIDAGANKMNYSYWIAARGTTFKEWYKLYTARRVLIEHMRKVQLDMGIEFMNVSQPVVVTTNPIMRDHGLEYQDTTTAHHVHFS